MKLFTQLFVLFNITSIFAAPIIKTRYFYAEGGESLRAFLEKKVGLSKKLLDKRGYYEKIKLWNPSIQNTDSLSLNEQVYIEVPFQTQLAIQGPREIASVSKIQEVTVKDKEVKQLSSNNLKKVSRTSLESTSTKSNIFRPKKKGPNEWRYSFSYSFLAGNLTESINGTNIETTANQDSAITLGARASKKISKNLTYQGGLNYSIFESAQAESEVQISIPSQYRLYSSLIYTKEKWPVRPEVGISYHRLSSFNTEELSLGEPLSVRTHNLAFLNLGVNKDFTLFKQDFSARLNLGVSFLSSESRPSLVTPETFSGNIINFDLNYKFNRKWNYSFFYESQSLTGATDLSLTRAGLGVQYFL